MGITIFEADDEAARAVVNGDPAVAGGVFEATLHPYAVAVARDGSGPALSCPSSAQHPVRTSRRSTLPMSDFGSSSTTKIRRGTL